MSSHNRATRAYRRGAVLAGLVAGIGCALAPPAGASVIVYKCDPQTLCAISPEGGSSHTLIAKSLGVFIASPTLTADGKTFATAFPTTSPVGSRLVSGSAHLERAVTSQQDRTSLHDLRPPFSGGHDYYENVAFPSNATSFIYTVHHSMLPATYAVRLASGATDTLVASLPDFSSVSLGALGGAPLYRTGFRESQTTCLVVPGNPCRPIAPGLGVITGSRNGRYLLTSDPAPGANPSSESAAYDLHVRDAATLKVLSTFPRAYGTLSPDNRFVVFTAVPKSGRDEDYTIKVAPIDGSARPRELAHGSDPVWGGTQGAATTIAGAAAPRLTAPAKVSGSAVRRIRLVVTAPKGTTVRASAKAGGKKFATKRAVTRARRTVLRLKASSAGARRARRAGKIRVALRVGDTFSIRRTIRVR